MRTLTGINHHRRSTEGWIQLPLVIRGLEESERVALDIGGSRYIVGHVTRSRFLWWLIPDWRTNASDLHRYEVS